METPLGRRLEDNFEMNIREAHFSGYKLDSADSNMVQRRSERGEPPDSIPTVILKINFFWYVTLYSLV
jgi:hypothetical protein